MEEQFERDDLTYQVIEFDEKHGGPQLVLWDKQLNQTDHYVMLHGVQKDSKINCKKLAKFQNGQVVIKNEYNDIHEIAEVAREMGFDNYK